MSQDQRAIKRVPETPFVVRAATRIASSIGPCCLHTGCLDSATFLIQYLTEQLHICSDRCSWYGICRFSQPRTVLPSHSAPASIGCACALAFQLSYFTYVYMVAENIPCWKKVPNFWDGSCDGPLLPIATESGELPVGFKQMFCTPYPFRSAGAAAAVRAAAAAVPKWGVQKQ